ncbi:helix-turn-helix domain-containing protein [Pedobacter hiemivivus]|uniref:Helix-turn-helix domain-containing protein n=1 Tax=Pedobacter hiemivivus TaxID=2530454 RepID=A0A4U1GJT2_9SPHI|nr:helix-turn-helix domain-containing protein [Pedobacter hiemivivus]
MKIINTSSGCSEKKSALHPPISGKPISHHRKNTISISNCIHLNPTTTLHEKGIYRLEKITIRHIASTQKEPDLLGNFSIRDLQNLLAGKDMVQDLHRHDFFYLLALERGNGHHAIDFIPHHVGRYSVFFMRPGQVHELQLKSKSTGYLMQFSTEFYFPQDKGGLSLLRKASTINHYQLNKESFGKITSTLESIQQEFSSKKEAYNVVIKSNMDLLLIELIRNQTSAPEKVNLHTQEKLEVFMGLLEKNIFKHKQVSQYADMLNLSVYQLNSIVNAALGKTCSAVINEQIILEAKRCILATSIQINQTAYRLGYEDVSYFIRFFKKHTGHTPDSFRQNFK